MPVWFRRIFARWRRRKTVPKYKLIEKGSSDTSQQKYDSAKEFEASDYPAKEKIVLKVQPRIDSSHTSPGPDIGPDFTYLYPTFTHSPINIANNEFRLVKIERDESLNPPVQLRVCQFSAKDAPEYTALSYARGGQQDKRDIAINAGRVKCGANLLSFLQTLAISDQPQWYWIDALCINQSNALERNHQTSILSDIYSSATKVIAYLGPAADESEIAFDLITRFNNDSVDTPVKALDRYYKSAILPLFKRSYWRRLWIVEEILLASELVVQCGNQTMEWIDLATFVSEYLGLHEPGPARQREIPSHVVTIFNEKEATASNKRSLSHLIESFKTFECMDTRDRIFAIHAILPPASRTQLVVDYSKSIKKLYVEVLTEVAAFEPEKTIHEHVEFSETLRSVLKLTLVLEEGLIEEFMTEDVRRAFAKDGNQVWDSRALEVGFPFLGYLWIWLIICRLPLLLFHGMYCMDRHPVRILVARHMGIDSHPPVNFIARRLCSIDIAGYLLVHAQVHCNPADPSRSIGDTQRAKLLREFLNERNDDLVARGLVLVGLFSQSVCDRYLNWRLGVSKVWISTYGLGRASYGHPM
jgi:hypothetical protein